MIYILESCAVNLSKRQKSGLAVLAVALLALVVDRALLGGGSAPAGASASSNEAPAKVAPEPELKDPCEPDSEPAAVKLSQRLETLWSEGNPDVSQARDLFSLPARWLADVNPVAPADESPEQDPVTAFAASHQLRGVVRANQADLHCVTVDDQVLRLGEKLDGFELVAIGDDSATFEAGGKQVTLKLVSDR